MDLLFGSFLEINLDKISKHYYNHLRKRKEGEL